ncbi:WxL protein peptidoglycan domain-containing protein [Aquihabitans sp. McL0605]|uniref:WxL protein peptidoglycan domain-containing protein n=1 Tax=Aquihabitans sp. McL0605 TaxID=3415671 RepID=UPI003CEFECD8
MSSKSRSPRFGVIAALLAILVAGLLPGTSAAQDAGGGGDQAASPSPGPWSFAPTSSQSGPGRNWYILDLQPGQALRDSVAIANTTTAPISFAIYSADAYNTPNGGQFAIRSATDAKKGVSKWVTLATDAYTVQPGRRVVIPFEIKVPDDAGPGDHAGAIAAMDVNPEGQTQSSGVKLDIMRVLGIRLYVRVAGPVSEKVGISDTKITTHAPPLGVGGSKSGTVSYKVTNTGNATISPKVHATVSGGLGGPDPRLPVHVVHGLLPGNSVVFRDSWKGLPVIGPVTVKVAAADGDAHASAESVAWIVPWPLLLLLGMLLAAAVVLLVRRRRRRRDRRTHPSGPPAGEVARQAEPVNA